VVIKTPMKKLETKVIVCAPENLVDNIRTTIGVIPVTVHLVIKRR
jgi:hypothetical protein